MTQGRTRSPPLGAPHPFPLGGKWGGGSVGERKRDMEWTWVGLKSWRLRRTLVPFEAKLVLLEMGACEELTCTEGSSERKE